MHADTAHEKPHVPQLTQLTSDQDLFFKLKTRDFCCTPLQFFVSCTISEAVTHFQRLWGLNIYGLEAAAMIADLFTSSGRGVALLRNVLRLCATATPVGDLEVNSLRRYAIFLCTPRAAVCLLRELGLVKERYCKLLPFLGQQNGLLRSNRLVCAKNCSWTRWTASLGSPWARCASASCTGKLSPTPTNHCTPTTTRCM